MIWLPSRELLILTPPKCGSTSLHTHLCRPEVGGIFVIGPQPDGSIDKHTTAVPYDAKHARKVVVVRNPYDRAASIQWHSRTASDPPPVSPEQFAKALGSYRRDDGGDWFAMPVAHLVDGVACNWWQLENIDACLANEGLPVRVPRENVNLHPLLPERLREVIQPWAEIDCKAFGY